MVESEGTRFGHHTAERHNDTNAPFKQGQNDALSRLRRIAAADEEATEYAQAWQAEPGDELVGRFISWSEGTTKRGERHRIAIVENEAGQRIAVWAFYTVLKAKLEEANPQPGEMILIQRGKDRESNKDNGGKPRTYRDYRVAVDRHEG